MFSFWSYAIDPIVEALSSLDPLHAADFERQGQIAKASLLEGDAQIFERLQEIPCENRFLVTSHDAFNYFSRRYLAPPDDNWREHFMAPEGLSPDSQLSTAHISEIIKYMSRYQVKVIFPESNVSRDSLKKIVLACQEKGMPIKISQKVLYGDALGERGSQADTYLKMMKLNSETLFQEWQGEGKE